MHSQVEHQLSSPLFRLPYEIRLAIYEFYLLPGNQPNYYLCTPTPIETFLARRPFRRDNIPGLVLACKRLHAELAPLVFDTITFVVRHNYHHSSTALGSFGLLDFPRIKKLVYIMERTTERAWKEHSPVFLRRPGQKGKWWAAGWQEDLCYRCGDPQPYCGHADLPTLSGLKEVVFLVGPSQPWYHEQFRRAPGWYTYGRPRRVDILETLAGLKGLETIRIGGHYQDWCLSYLQERTAARVLLEPSHLLREHNLP